MPKSNGPPHLQASCCQEWQFHISFVTAHIERSTGRHTPLPTGILLPRMAISDFCCYSSYRKINWQTYPLHLQASCGQGWQFQISIVTAHIERSIGRSNPPKYRYTLAKNGNFRFLCSHIGRPTGRFTPQNIQ